jgi:2-polyprenyl-6-methoxyphenol hydroxylase-like FAD-dependent oxidoreductase
MDVRTIETTCCIAGGGPAGIMLGYLLARQGVAVTVLEKHTDFFRDFRGDTVHPSTLEVMRELDLLDDLLKLPHQRLTSVGGMFGGYRFQAANFRYVPTHCKFVAMMPQWDFLNFLSERARQFPSFDLRMGHEATALVEENGRIVGVASESLKIRAHLVVGCDGRQSILRTAAQMEVVETGVPIDVLWFRISRREDDPDQLLGNLNYGKALVLINRGDYFQAGLIIRKGSFDEIRDAGMDAFRITIVQIAPYLLDRVDELQDWDQVKLLTVQINRLRTWHRPGLLFIGDAAHAMSPAGGVGINLAIQDAVAASNILADALRERRATDELLAQVQYRREFPARVTQAVQANAHKAFAWVFRQTGPMKAPWPLKVVMRIPGLQHVTGRLVGVGVRPEHVRPVKIKQNKLTRFAIAAGIVAGVAMRWLRST